jgi:hypothetical protein
MQEGRSMAARRKVVFLRERRFDKEVESLGLSNLPVILSDLLAFEHAWNRVVQAIPDRFRYEEYKGVKGSYVVIQIYVGPRRSFRATAAILDDRDEAHWVHAFKKQAQREPEHVALAKTRARDLWDKLRRRQ